MRRGGREAALAPLRLGRVVAALLLAAALLGGASLLRPQRPENRTPRLVLFLSVDQMRFDYLTRFGPLFKGGFRTLLDRGAVFTNARYRHANNETGPGHAVLTSGRSGNHSGIIANQWFDPLAKRVVNVVEDPRVTPVGGPGPSSSPVNFTGFTVGDILKKQSPASQVVGVALKDRSAILMAGPGADGAYWYSTAAGAFITSTYYTKTVPEWLARWNAKRLADGPTVKTWERLLPDEGLYRQYAGVDDIKGERDGLDTVFPHRVHGVVPQQEFYDDLRRTPFADELTLDVALEAMAAHQMGEDEATDILAVGFSAADVIGHSYGPDSQEIMDQLLRLDLTVGRLLEAAEGRAGTGRVLVVLSADHGVLPLVEVLQAQGVPARRARTDEIAGPVTRALEARFGKGSGLVARFLTPDFYLDLQAIEGLGVERRDVEAVAREALLATGLVEKVYTHDDLLGDPPAGDPFFAMMLRTFFPSRSPHLTVVPKEYVYLDDRPGGTGHGTPWDYDRHVPVVFLGPRVVPGTYPEPCGPEDIAPTLGRLLRLDYPRQDAERVLSEMIRGD